MIHPLFRQLVFLLLTDCMTYDFHLVHGSYSADEKISLFL